MADFNSSLPIRTESNGDAAVKVVDGTTPAQALSVDAAGAVKAKLLDGAGTAVTSQASGGQQALDVGINVGGTQVDPRDVRALTSSDVVTANQGAANTAANGWPVKPTDGTNSQVFTAAGEATVSVTQPLPAGTNNIGKVELTDGTNTAAVLATGEVKVAVTQPLPAGSNNIGVVNAHISDATGTAFSGSNPLPVTISGATTGDEVLDFKQASAVAANATDTHTYTITAGKTLTLQHIQATGSGKIKVEIKLGTIGAEALKVVLFNSTSNPNVDYVFAAPQQLDDTMDVVVIVHNLDKQSQDVYSTIEGFES